MVKRLFLILFVILVGCTPSGSVGSPPPVSVVVNDSTYNTKLGSYSWSSKGLLSSIGVDADGESPYNIAIDMEPIPVRKSSKIEILTENKPTLSVYIWDDESTGDYEVPLDDNMLEVPDEPGRYVYEVYAEWDQGNGSYTFVIEVE
jgi:hypothetical protein